MAIETCVGCGGTDRGSGECGDCVFRNGMGAIWVPDKPKPGPIGGGGGGSESFEDLVASLLGLASWGLLAYYELTSSDLEWYWPVIGGAVTALFVGWLLKGPLRFFLTIAKYILFIAGLAWGIYLIYYLFRAFSEV